MNATGVRRPAMPPVGLVAIILMLTSVAMSQISRQQVAKHHA
jgi:hypothetical protein